MHRVGVVGPDGPADRRRWTPTGCWRWATTTAPATCDIMRSVRAGGDRRQLVRDVVDTRRVPYPVQVIWGARDPILALRRRGLEMLAATGLEVMTAVDGKHFIQEDCAPAVASAVRRIALG